MSNELQVPVEILPSNGLTASEAASFGAILTASGLTQLQVQGIVSRIQKLAAQVAIGTVAEVLEDVRKINESRMWEIVNRIGALPTMAGYVNKNQVTQIVTEVAARSPRQ